MSRTTTPPPADTLTILAADLLATHAGNLLAQLAYAGDWEPATRLKDAMQTYSEVRIGAALSAGADEILRHIEDKAPDTLKTGEVRS